MKTEPDIPVLFAVIMIVLMLVPACTKSAELGLWHTLDGRDISKIMVILENDVDINALKDGWAPLHEAANQNLLKSWKF